MVKSRGKIYYQNFTVNGDRFRGSLKTDDRDTAEILAAEIRKNALLGKLIDKKPERTLDEALGKYWLEIGQRLESKGDLQYRARVLKAGLGAATLLSAITPANLRTYASLRLTGRSNASVNRELRLLRAVINCARDVWGVATPTIKWSDVLLDEPEYRQRILSGEEEARLFAALREDFHAMIRFALITGVRLKNILRLSWNQVKWELRHIVFRVKSKKPGKKVLYIPFTTEIEAILIAERGRHPTRVFTWVCRKNDHNRKTGARRIKGERYRFSDGGWRDSWWKAVEAAGLREGTGQHSPDDFRFHDLRHTAATRVHRKTRNLKTVQRLLGHADIRTTARYIHTDVEDVREGLEGI
jgi:integrase